MITFTDEMMQQLKLHKETVDALLECGALPDDGTFFLFNILDSASGDPPAIYALGEGNQDMVLGALLQYLTECFGVQTLPLEDLEVLVDAANQNTHDNPTDQGGDPTLN